MNKLDMSEMQAISEHAQKPTVFDKAAYIVLKKCMNLKKNEKLLIVYDINKKDIADILIKRAMSMTKYADKIKTKVAKENGEEPLKHVADKMLGYDIVLLVTTKSLSHTDARRRASKKGARIASMPNITKEMMKRALTADYQKIRKISKKIYDSIKNKKIIRLSTKIGTNLTIPARKPMFKDLGLYHKKGSFGNLPAGEVGFAPIEKKTNGILVIDKTMAGIGKLKKPIRMLIKNGFARKIEGGKEAHKLKRLLKNFKNNNVYNIAEFAIGTNYKARISGITLEDEKVFGTAHIALGDNTSYPGGKIKAPTHLDGVISKPTLIADNKKIMEQGILLI